MTNVVELTINLGGFYFSEHQKVCGEIVSEGTTEKGDGYIVFRDAESEEPHKIFKRKIISIADVQPSPTKLPGN